MVLTSVVCLLSSNRNPQPASFQVETHTAATVEVDVMPFLGRADWGGPFNAYYEALANLGSNTVTLVLFILVVMFCFSFAQMER